MGLTSLVVTILGLILLVVGVIALVNASWIAGGILVIAGLIVLSAGRGGIAL